MKLVFYFVLCLPSIVAAQGIQFEEGMNWRQLKEKAALENKYIFLDCYTTWCGPCKRMSKEIFSQAKVGSYFNENFISASVQMDKTQKDGEEVKAWYVDAKSIAAEFHVNEYPTYLFFSPNGEVVHKESGATDSQEDFINIAESALDSNLQNYTLVRHYRAHVGDSAYLRRALIAAAETGDTESAVTIGNSLVQCLKNPTSRENLDLIDKFKLIRTSDDVAFKLFEQNAGAIDSLMGDEGYAEWALSEAIFNEKIEPLYSMAPCVLSWQNITQELRESFPKLSLALIDIERGNFAYKIKQEIKMTVYKSGSGAPNWQLISAKLKGKYPDFDFTRTMLDVESEYYYKKGEWSACEKSAYLLIHRYGQFIGDRDINNIAWDYIFMHGRSRKTLREALEWMKRSVKRDPERGINLDTYANLLYKDGRRSEALYWEGKAIEKTQNENDLKAIRANLDKIKKSLPTWASDSMLISG